MDERENLPTEDNEPLVAMCHEAVWRIRAGETNYEQELDRLCEELGEPRERVRPVLDRIYQKDKPGESSRGNA